MTLKIGYIPYLNMVPFHQGFGPEPIQTDGFSATFQTLTPNALGLEAEAGRIDAGAMSLVDFFRLSDRFEALGSFGIGVKQAAGSVLVFSKKPLAELSGICAVTDETSTSVRLLQVLLDKRYNRTGVSYGRIAAGLFDGDADALLLIGDEALKARRDGVKGFPIVTDLGAEWLAWQGIPFVFARWAALKSLDSPVKDSLKGYLENSLKTSILDRHSILNKEGISRGFSPQEVETYWDGFIFKLTPGHEASILRFKELLESVCLTA